MADFTVERPTTADRLEHLTSLVRMLLNDLPSQRDWLDPQLEDALRAAVKAKTPASNHKALLDRWALNHVKSIQKLARKNGMR